MLRLSVVLVLLSSAAEACPGGDALEHGIRFEIAGGETETFRRHGPHVVAATYAIAGGPVSQVLLAQGLYMIEAVDIQDGALVPPSRTTYTFEVEPGRMPRPVAGAVWETRVTVSEGGDLMVEPQRYSYGAETQVSFGSCTYVMTPVEIRYPQAAEDTVEFIHYLPELGLSYLARTTWERGEERYHYLGIEALE